MSKKHDTETPTPQDEEVLEQVPEAAADTPGQEPEGAESQAGELDALKAQLKDQEDKFLRLAAEYDNYRKRSQRERSDAYQSAKADAALAFLPVFDNLERALKQETCDEAYKKGVEMTMTGLQEVLGKLGVEEIPALGQPFDPNLHNAVMHVEDETLGENIVAEVFQAGFRLGEKVIRFSVVKVAN